MTDTDTVKLELVENSKDRSFPAWLFDLKPLMVEVPEP